MASKGTGTLNSVGTKKISVRNIGKLEGTLSTKEIEYIKKASQEQGWNINYDSKYGLLHITDPQNKNNHFVFHKEFLTDPSFNLSGKEDDRYSLRDMFDYYNHLPPTLQGNVTHFEFDRAVFTEDGRPILGSFDYRHNRILINPNNFHYSKHNAQNLEYTFQHESLHGLDWKYRSSNRVNSMFSKHKAWKKVSDGKTPTEYSRIVKDLNNPLYVQRAENFAEVSAYVQLAKRYGGSNVRVSTTKGTMLYNDWAKQKDVKPMIKLAKEFVENPEKYVSKHLEDGETLPLLLK